MHTESLSLTAVASDREQASQVRPKNDVLVDKLRLRRERGGGRTRLASSMTVAICSCLTCAGMKEDVTKKGGGGGGGVLWKRGRQCGERATFHLGVLNDSGDLHLCNAISRVEGFVTEGRGRVAMKEVRWWAGAPWRPR